MRRKWMRMAGLALGTALLAAGMAAAAWAQEQVKEEVDQIIECMTLEEKVGQMIIADIRNWNEHPEKEDSEVVPVTELIDELGETISDDRFGGVILFAENCGNNEKLKKLVEDIEAANLLTEGECVIPLLISIDQEGGIVTRLGQGTGMIGNMALAATGDPENARISAQIIGQELAAFGINTDFAPVLDVNSNPANPVIGVRSFSDKPELVSVFGKEVIDGLEEEGIITSLKHFPGHGDTAVDSHTGLPMVEKTYDELKEKELIPFRDAIAQGADMVMTAHIQYPLIEKGTYTSTSTGEEVTIPATLSHTILTDILRGDMGFDGVIVSDALDMGAIHDHFAFEDVCRMALDAGVDMFLMPVNLKDRDSIKKMRDMIDDLVKLVEDGEVSEERIDDSVRRILIMKQDHGLSAQPAAGQTAAGEETEVYAAEEETEVYTAEEETEVYTAGEESEVSAAEVETEVPGAGSEDDGLSAVGGEEHRRIAWELAQKAICMQKNEDAIPLDLKEGEKVLLLLSAAGQAGYTALLEDRLKEAGILPQQVEFESMVCENGNEEKCVEAAKKADHVILMSALLSVQGLNPETEAGLYSKIMDQVIEAVHEEGKKVIMISCRLPYDAARFQEADAILLCFGYKPLPEVIDEHTDYVINPLAGLLAAFGTFEPVGKLPVDLPKLNDQWEFSDELLAEGYTLE